MSRWQHLDATPNTQPNLIIKAKSLANFLTHDAFEHASAFVDLLIENKKIQESQFRDAVGTIYLDCVWFGMHYVDRMAYSHLDEPSRDIFFDVLLIEIEESLRKQQEAAGDADTDVFVRSFRRELDDLQVEYSTYGFGTDVESNLCFQFGLRLAQVLGFPREQVFGTAMLITSLIFFDQLDLESLLNLRKQCKKCNKQSAPAAKFCNACGEKLATSN